MMEFFQQVQHEALLTAIASVEMASYLMLWQKLTTSPSPRCRFDVCSSGTAAPAVVVWAKTKGGTHFGFETNRNNQTKIAGKI